jgi:hypothetical protein
LKSHLGLSAHFSIPKASMTAGIVDSKKQTLHLHPSKVDQKVLLNETTTNVDIQLKDP